MMPQEATIALQNLRRALPEGHWVPEHIERTINNFLPSEGDPTPMQVETVVAYIKWVTRYPQEVGEDDKPLYDCTCRDVGWVETDDGRWRPCLRCNAETFERFESIGEADEDDT
jgi:hypothetical protein